MTIIDKDFLRSIIRSGEHKVEQGVPPIEALTGSSDKTTQRLFWIEHSLSEIHKKMDGHFEHMMAMYRIGKAEGRMEGLAEVIMKSALTDDGERLIKILEALKE